MAKQFKITTKIAPNLSDNKQILDEDLHVSGVLTAEQLTGSLTVLPDGNPYMIGAGSVSITTGSNGQITISGSGTPGDGGGTDTDWDENNGAYLSTTSSVRIQNSLTASNIANGSQFNGSQLLSSTTGVLDIDASQGPNYHWNIDEDAEIATPSNGVIGQTIQISAVQVSGNNVVTFNTGSWESVGQIDELAQNSGSFSVITAISRNHGNGLKWLYSITHFESYDDIFYVDVTGSTTGSEQNTLTQGYLTENGKIGLFDLNIMAKSTASYEAAHFGLRSLFYRTGSSTINLDENLYSSFKSNSSWAVTHSYDGNIINIDVVGSGSQDVDWAIKGIFQIL